MELSTLAPNVSVVSLIFAGPAVALIVNGADSGGIIEKVVEETSCPDVQTLAPHVLLNSTSGTA